ncbi:nuclear mRNA splicing protein [Fomitiporia mediterranea MF3/22]|uniref:nuclear mRNA splicing protein n=1 Tax=Fomitiporia mediterranea (strain MF3/22) TaxID=694068 RepID=UPI00044092D3|nr:nuclear mRNA splicing protein [Fomitiporia mediterranea MF3/22]EJD03245.1 nuclear mRNA splicing protein [Fomitiporia mediterranea MF3/22]
MAPSRGPQAIPRTLHITLNNHKGAVHVARYAKGTSKYVLTGGQDRSVRLWNPATGLEIKTYAGHGYEVLSITVAHDNVKFASSGGDRSVFLWDVATANTIRRFAGHMGKINAVEFNEDASVLASGSFDGTVRLWDLRSQSRQAIQTLSEARDAIQTLSVGNTYITSGSVDGHIRTYDLRKGELRSDYLGQPVTSVQPMQDSTAILVTTLDSHIRLLDMQTGKMLNDFTGHTNESFRCRACFGHAEASVICGDENGQAKPLAPNPPPKVHEKVITWVEHHPIDVGEMVTASADGTVKVWKQ